MADPAPKPDPKPPAPRNPLISRRHAIQGALAFTAILVSGASLRLDAPAAGYLVLSREELDLVDALSLCWFPKGSMPKDGVEAKTADEVDRILGDLVERPARVGFRYALRALQWGTFASRGARFVDLPVEDRREVLDVWMDPTFLPRRASLDLLKLILGMAYYADADVVAATGWTAICGGTPT